MGDKVAGSPDHATRIGFRRHFGCEGFQSNSGILHQARLAQRHTLRTCLGEEASRSSCWHGLPRQAIVDVCADCLGQVRNEGANDEKIEERSDVERQTQENSPVNDADRTDVLHPSKFGADDQQ
ncbi:hypothetical protein ACVWYH_005423 [Bradyrhizobium sp. GM24.11]